MSYASSPVKIILLSSFLSAIILRKLYKYHKSVPRGVTQDDKSKCSNANLHSDKYV